MSKKNICNKKVIPVKSTIQEPLLQPPLPTMMNKQYSIFNFLQCLSFGLGNSLPNIDDRNNSKTQNQK